VRGKNGPQPDTCTNHPPLANPAMVRDYIVRYVAQATIDDVGDKEIDVNTTDKGEDTVLRYFRTSEACDAAAKAVKDEQAANDKYR
jgi:hypothetical protein